MADAAVVIVHYRRPDLTTACLRALPAASGLLDLETVVIDNGSGNGSADEIALPHADTEIVRLPENRGFAAGVNAGFAHSTAPIVVLLNADTVPDGKVHVPPVEHRHGPLFVGLALVPEGDALLKDWGAIGSFNREFWLEDPCFIAAFLRLALFIDQK